MIQVKASIGIHFGKAHTGAVSSAKGSFEVFGDGTVVSLFDYFGELSVLNVFLVVAFEYRTLSFFLFLFFILFIFYRGWGGT